MLSVNSNPVINPQVTSSTAFRGKGGKINQQKAVDMASKIADEVKLSQKSPAEIKETVMRDMLKDGLWKNILKIFKK